VHTSERRDEEKPAERFAGRKARSVERAANGADGTCSRNPATVVLNERQKKRMKFLNRDFNAAINFRRCALLKTEPEELRRYNFVRQPLPAEVYEVKMKTIAVGRLKETGSCPRMGISSPWKELKLSLHRSYAAAALCVPSFQYIEAK